MKELILKLGFLSNQEKKKEKETKAVTNSKAKETPDTDTISGIAFNNDKKENTLKGCFFSKEE